MAAREQGASGELLRASDGRWTQLLATALVVLCSQDAAAARLPSGSAIVLELMQTISSAYSDPDAPIYFRVRDDVAADGAILVRRGTLVTGRLTNLRERGGSAQSAKLSLDVSTITAVDGQPVRVIADMTRAGRSRDDAMTFGFIFVGAFGLLTRGAEVWIPAGSLLEALVLNDRAIDPSKNGNVSPDASPAVRSRASVTNVRVDGMPPGAIRIKVDHPPALGMLRIQLGGIASTSPEVAPADSWQVVRVGDLDLPQPLGVTASGGVLAIPAWSVLRYCRDGTNRVLLVGKRGGEEWEAEAELKFEPIIKR